MDQKTIVEAINNARKGIRQYLEITRLFSVTDVSLNTEFQRKYNNFYRVRQRDKHFYETYYQYMQCLKGQNVEFQQVLRFLHSKLNRFEPSFSSKLAATHNPNLPIWDEIVLTNAGIKRPSSYSIDRMNKTTATYEKIKEWYSRYMNSEEGHLVVNLFDDIVDESSSITDLKKVDFVLWRIRTYTKHHSGRHFLRPAGKGTPSMNNNLGVEPTDDNSVIVTIKNKFFKTGRPTEIPLLKERRGRRSFLAKLLDEGIWVGNLGKYPFLPWEVFQETIRILVKNDGRAKRGDAMNCRLSEPNLPKDSIEGHIAHVVYGKQEGETVFRRITPIACMLIWAGVCKAGRGELILLENK